MAEYSRVTPSGWTHADDTETFSRVSPDGWEYQEGVAAQGGIIGPLTKSRLIHSPLVSGRLVQ